MRVIWLSYGSSGIVAVSHRGNVLNGDFFFCPLVSEGFSISMAVVGIGQRTTHMVS